MKVLRLILFLSVILLVERATAQFDFPGGQIPVGLDNQGRPFATDTTNQVLEKRDRFADSISIYYKYFDSSIIRSFDSSINDFFTRYPVPWTYIDLGNFGNAARNLVYTPLMKPGFDAGFHAYDIYNYNYQNTRFFQSTRPYTETAYLLGSRGEQLIDLLHTQNRGANFNFTFNYRIINSQGSYQNQNTNHSNLRIATQYQSTNKRYNNQFIFINNRLRSSENGGVQDPQRLENLSLNDPFEADTRLGGNTLTFRAIFSSEIGTGTTYYDSRFLMRQTYDLGQKDSIVNDSDVVRLFYPRIRFQHSVNFENSKFKFQDLGPDASLYRQFYNYAITTDTVFFEDKWQQLTNDFSIISFPEKNNLNQFVRASAGLENIWGNFEYSDTAMNNIYISGEYRNRTRNRLWEIEAVGKFYVTGPYAGNFAALASLKKSIKNNKGSLLLGLQTVNRTPAYIFQNNSSSFPVFSNESFNNENILRFFSQVEVPGIDLRLEGNFYVISNYLYFKSFFQPAQEATLFNLLHINALKKFELSKHWNWYSELHVQQATGNPPFNIPLALTRNRLAYEGLFFTNLNLSTGIELRYYLPYKGDNYDPFNGQFMYQDTITLRNRPDINLFLHFRIKSFKGFIRAEGLNAINEQDGFSFTKFNFHAPNFGSRGFWFRLGIWWSFVN